MEKHKNFLKNVEMQFKIEKKNPWNSVHPTKNHKNRLIGFGEAVFGSQNGPVLPDFRLNRLTDFKL